MLKKKSRSGLILEAHEGLQKWRAAREAKIGGGLTAQEAEEYDTMMHRTCSWNYTVLALYCEYLSTIKPCDEILKDRPQVYRGL